MEIETFGQWALLSPTVLLLLALSIRWFRAPGARPWLVVGRDILLSVVVLAGILAMLQPPRNMTGAATTLGFSALLIGPAAVLAAAFVRLLKRRGVRAVPAVTLAALGGITIWWGVAIIVSIGSVLTFGLPPQD